MSIYRMNVVFLFCLLIRREDSGILMYKDHLPVSQVVVRDVHRSGSEARLTVGPLRCQGDRKCTNQGFTLSTSRQYKKDCLYLFF